MHPAFAYKTDKISVSDGYTTNNKELNEQKGTIA